MGSKQPKGARTHKAYSRNPFLLPSSQAYEDSAHLSRRGPPRGGGHVAVARLLLGGRGLDRAPGVEGEKVETAAAGNQTSRCTAFPRRRRFSGLLQAFSSRRRRSVGGSVSRRLAARYGPQDVEVPVLRTASPNSDQAVEFIRRLAPDMMFARCKTILAARVFSIPRNGTYVMHPGIVPEYRNSHGCFWALSNRDLDKVGRHCSGSTKASTRARFTAISAIRTTKAQSRIQ